MTDLDKLFLRAARSALSAWKGDFREDEDLVSDLWVWYLESPSVQKKIQGADGALSQTLVRRQALNILSGKALDYDVFHGRTVYSSDAVKDALLGVSTNHYLFDILPMALRALDAQNEGQAEAIRRRYEDNALPRQNSAEQSVLKRAVKSLTEHVNVITVNAGVDLEGRYTEGPGSRNSVFPETRRSTGDGHSDPTADMAISLALHGDDPITYRGKPDYLCATFVDEDGVTRAARTGGAVVYTDQTTTLRKEFES